MSCIVGGYVGLGVGCLVGDLVGRNVDPSLGLALETFVSFCDGAYVGSCDGISGGLLVGSMLVGNGSWEYVGLGVGLLLEV